MLFMPLLFSKTLHRFFLTVLICHELSRAMAGSYHVGTGFPFLKVSDAIAAAQSGDSVIVHGGLYKEGNIIVTRSISLIGIDKPILDGQKKFEVLSIKANHVLVTGFKIQFSGH